MTDLLTKQQHLYATRGLVPRIHFVAAKDAAPLLGWLADQSASHAKVRDKVVGGVPGEFGERRRYRDTVMDGNVLLHNPTLCDVYERLRRTAAQISQRDVVCSPFAQSCMTMKLYDEPGCEHGWHVESNSLSALLYLTDVNEDGRLEYCPPGDDRNIVFHHLPFAGETILLKGHNVWHRVPPMLKCATPRVCVVFNYYHPDEIDRPAGLDGLHYK